MAVWIDATSYSQGQRGKVEPTAWECKLDGLRVWISCGHRMNPDKWVLTCRELNKEAVAIADASLSLDGAKRHALEVCYTRAKKDISALELWADKLLEAM